MFRTGPELDFASSSPLYSNQNEPGPDPLRLTISGVLRDPHLRGAGGGLLGSGFGVVEGFSPAAFWASSRNDGGPARLGSARPGRDAAPPAALPGSAGPAAVALGSRPGTSDCARAALRQLPLGRHGSGFGRRSVSARCRSSAAASHLSFSRQKGRGCRKEGGKEENARRPPGN